LLSHGFKEVPDNPGTYELKHVRVGDVLRELDVSPTRLRPVVSGQRPDEVFIAQTPSLNLTLRPDQPLKIHRTDGSFADMDAICAVEVWFPAPKQNYLKTDSTPHLHIRSVTVQRDLSKPFVVALEITATGNKPVSIQASDFTADCRGGNIPDSFGFSPRFPEGIPGIITVSPGKPLACDVWISVEGMPTGHLSPGRYKLRIGICPFKGREPQSYDYEWEGDEYWSNEYTFLIGKEERR
jgi:hypothetical protein